MIGVLVVGILKERSKMSKKYNSSNKVIMEQYNQIKKDQPVYAGDLISKQSVSELLDLGIVTRNSDGDYVLTNRS